ncbi:alpha/beta hydrolase [Brucella anthropi]|jgi:pimeloyl-ACP methyl ester carboxylesterase|uniref:Alpha/beta hydrolase n=2 Tax=Brucella TaxID=234 RepID=A0A7V7VQM8_9HYPH|nr:MULTISPECIES: alpha/beta hydrolase [Brucella/Ochrobactrum group]KAB2697556.1 alpha/beta hydrolase [Ochrobactrum sp. Kaboul]KAB2654807.1 alpha/beta hydrolase [Brucella tritici]KAB2757531.1 alpha/beta hydrolase [Brucella anthropi]KAB2773913.1 alpha/beta hydrolase [Brucella anthropi]MCQ9147571.1 alpha/beta hydrolase [Ochrobactrum sp. BTU2]
MIRNDTIIDVGPLQLEATVISPDTTIPGILFLHGWAGNQERDIERAKSISELGCVCLTFDMRGHGHTITSNKTVTRGENLDDVIAAYDRLASLKMVEEGSIVVVGSSYGGYLATLLTEFRPVRWLALRAPALYRDSSWQLPKAQLDRVDLEAYRSALVGAEDNRALHQAREFHGDVLLVESEHDTIVPHPTIASYQSAFIHAHSLTVRTLGGADHALSDAIYLKAYNQLLTRWIREMVLGAR